MKLEIRTRLLFVEKVKKRVWMKIVNLNHLSSDPYLNRKRFKKYNYKTSDFIKVVSIFIFKVCFVKYEEEIIIIIIII